MKRILIFAGIFLFSFFLICENTLAEEKKSFQYFYADWCSHCKEVDKFFENNRIYENFNVEKLDFNNLFNKTKLLDLFKKHNYEGQAGIPAILIDEKLIVGDEPIISYFKSNFQLQKNSQKKERDNKGAISLMVLISAALADAINPCAFAVLILLLATIIKAKGKNQALISGIMFILAIFISYFLMGIGLYKAITAFNLPKYISLLVGFFAIFIGLANLKDVFWHGKFFVMEVPMNWRPKMKSIITRITNPSGAFFSGFLVSLFLLPCTSGPYVVILGLLAERVEMAKTLFLLILYNFIFILPMIMIVVGMYLGIKMKKLEEIREKNNRLLHLITGLIMILLGIYLVQSWI